MNTHQTDEAREAALLSSTASATISPQPAFATKIRYTRKKGIALLNSLGFEISERYFETLASPAVGKGPRVDCIFNGRHLYLAEDLISWAESRCKPGKSASEHVEAAE